MEPCEIASFPKLTVRFHSGRFPPRMEVDGYYDAGVCVAQRCLPTFLIVGAMKCGTGALMKALNQHPYLVSGRGEHGGREIHYFGSMRGAANATQYSLRFPLQGGDQPPRCR